MYDNKANEIGSHYGGLNTLPPSSNTRNSVAAAAMLQQMQNVPSSKNVNSTRTQNATLFKPAILSNESFVLDENVLIDFMLATNAKYL